MSTTVDERVVSMQFDNRNFESNVSTTMSTLDKLKQKLNLSGASKGLAEVESAARSCNLNPLCNAAETVGVKFDAMAIMAKRALENIVDSAYSAGKKIVSALTIDPIKSGFQEYETQINAVQTILANTESKGSTLEDVNAALDELNTYADKTIYNFTEMTRNIGTFTAAGVDLDTSVNAIKGIANLAAVSGSTSQQASTAMYQLSQALASGTVKLMDWNSVVNAGMGGEVFQNALKETARVHGIAIDQMIEEQGSFRETLSKGWLTSEILTETLQKFTLTTEGLTEAEIEANREMLRAKGYTEDQIEEIFKLGNTATNAATKVKTLTQMWDVLKEAAQSGWAQTWRIIFGDFEEAKSLFTPLTDFFTGIISGISDARNALVEKAMGSPFGGLLDSFNEIEETVTSVTSTIEDFSDVVNSVIMGEWGNGQTRFDALTEAGYDWAHIQNLVNEELGCSVRHATDYAAATGEVTEAQKDANKVQAQSILKLLDKSDAQLKEIGLTEQQIVALRTLEEQSEKTGIPINELIEDIDQLSGRSLLINSFKNAGQALCNVFTNIKNAWQDIFPPKSTEERAMAIYNVIAALHKFTLGIKEFTENKDNVDKLTRTFKGLFAAIDIVSTLVGGGFKIAFEILKEILSYFDMDILDLTANIGDAIVGFRDWIDSIIDIESVIKTIITYISEAATAISGWIDSVKNSEGLASFIDKIEGVATAIGDWIEGIKTAENIPQYIAVGIGTAIGTVLKYVGDLISSLVTMVTSGFKEIPGFMTEGFVSGLWDGIQTVAQSMIEFGKTILTTICEVLGIQSPSTEMKAIGEFTIQGFIEGIGNKLGDVWTTLKEFGSGVIDFIKNLDFGKIFAVAGSIGIIAFAYSIAKAFSSLSGVFNGVKKILKSVDDVVDAFAGSIKRIGKAVSNSLNAMAFKQLAISIAILVGCVVALALLDPSDMVNAISALASIAAILGLLFVVMNKLGSSKNPLADKTTVIDFSKMAAGIFAIAGAIMIMAIAAKMIGKMEQDELIKAGIGIAVLAGVLVGLMAATKLMARTSTGAASTSAYNAGKMLMSMAGAIIILVVAAKLIASMEWSEMAKAGVGLVVLAGIMVGLIAATKLIAKTEKGNISTGLEHTGKMLLKIAASILILVLAAKLIASMEWSEMAKAGVGLVALAGIMVGLMAATKLIAKTEKGNISTGIEHTGKMLLSIAAAMLILTVAAKIIAGMEWSEMAKAGVGLVALAGIMVGLTAATRLAGGNDLKGVASTILAMAVAIGVMAAAAVLLSLIDAASLAKGVIAIAALGGVVAAMTLATKGAGDCKGNLMAMAVAIAVMAASVALLSFIDVNSLAAATTALTILMGMFALMASQAGKASGAMGPLIVMTAAIAVMAGMLILLSKLTDADAAIKSAVALGALMVAMTVCLALLQNIGKNFSGAILGAVSLLAMAVPLLAFVGILAIMQNVQNATANAITLGVFATAMTALLAVLTVIGSFAAFALIGVLALTAMAIPMLAFVGILALMNNVKNAEENAKLLIKLMTVMTGLMVMLGIVAPLAAIGVAAMTALTGLMVAIGVLAVAVGALMEKFPELQTFLDTGIDTLVQLASGIGRVIGSFITGFAGEVLTILPMIGTSLSAFMVGVMPFVTGVKMVDEGVLTGAGYLTGAILAITAADLIAGISSFLTGGTSLASLGTELSNFMTNVQPFIDGAATIDPTIMEGVKALSEVILLLTAADILNGITSWLTGGTSMADFGSQLVPFGEAMKEFSDTVVGIDEGAVMAAANAGKIMAEMQSNLVGTGGVVQWFMGEKDMATFGSQLVAFGGAIVSFSESVAGKINEEAVTAAANAGSIMTEMQTNLVGTGGVVQWFTGEKDMATFGSQLLSFGDAIVGFSEKVTGSINEEAVTAAATAGSIMAEMQKSLEPMGGVVQWFTGEQDMATFGSQIVAFGESIVSFSETVAGSIDAEAVTAAANAGMLLTDLQKAIPEDKWFDGKVSIDDFGDSIAKFGGYIAEYSEKVADVDTGAVSSSVNSANALVNIAKSLADLDTENISSFNKVTDIGDAMATYSSSVAGIDVTSVTSSINAANKLKLLIGSLADLDTSGVSSFKSAITSLGDVSLAGIVETFSSAAETLSSIGSNLMDSMISGITSKQPTLVKTITSLGSSMSTAIRAKAAIFRLNGSYLMTNLIKGITNKKVQLTRTSKSIATAAASATRSTYNSFYYAGYYLVTGFANGISANTFIAIAKARAMAYAAYQAAKNALDINSPSKLFRKLGTSVPEGFAQGIDKLGWMVKDSAVAMADTAINGTKSAISRIADAIDSDIDTQPTIRPVVDLSDVESGIGAIGGMFGINPSVGVLAKVGAISYGMNTRQNVANNDDIVDSIIALGRKLGNMTGDTYNINGVSYEDGSAVSNAIKTIVRAARIERRV